MDKLTITRGGNIKIEVNPDRKYDGQFVGYRYFKGADVSRAFPAIADFGALDKAGYDIGAGADNEQMIQHHIQEYRSVGYICGQ